MRVLIVEDEPNLGRQLRSTLEGAGYAVDLATDGEDGHYLGTTETYDAVVLDLGLPEIDGLTVLDRWRKDGIRTPVLVLTARDSWSDKVAGLDAGADDYITKPFGIDELLARLRAAVRRATAEDHQPAITIGAFTVDLASKTVTGGGETVRLTPTEWHLLAVLARNPGKLVGQPQLLRELWGPGYEKQTNYLRVYMAQLRRKLETNPSRPRHLLTEPGLGYRFQP
jgi:two-component system, OmpR family, KDP operon response regulator KdpE